MYKFFISIAITLSLMGCASRNHKLENATNQVTESASSIEQAQKDFIIQDKDDVLQTVEGAKTTDEEYNNGENENYNNEHIISSEVENIEQPTPSQISENAQLTDTNAVATDVSDDNEIHDLETAAPQVPATDKVIYLTFDDGPSINTPKILDILQQENVKATFFVTGHHKGYLHLIKREFDEGHVIGAHTFSHQYEIYTSQDTYFDDLEKLQRVIEKQTGKRTKLIRFPGGSSNTIHSQYNEDPNFMPELCDEVRRRGYQYIDWNLTAKDTSQGHVPTDTIIEMASRGNGKNICLLMHDSFGKETTVEALPSIIRYYKENGYRFGILDAKSSGYHHIRRSRKP